MDKDNALSESAAAYFAVLMRGTRQCSRMPVMSVHDFITARYEAANRKWTMAKAEQALAALKAFYRTNYLSNARNDAGIKSPDGES